MWIFLIVQGQKKIRLGEIVSLRILVTNKWTESVDALISIPASKKYKVLEIDREDASKASQVKGEQQILVTIPAKAKTMIYVPVEPVYTGTVKIPINMLSVLGGHSKLQKVSVGYDGIKDANITNYQVDLRVANSERLPDLWISTEEKPEGDDYGERLNFYVPGSAKAYVHVIGDIVGISFFPGTDDNLQTKNLIGKPYYSGSEATFNFAMQLYTLNMLRSLGAVPKKKVKTITDNLNIAMQEMLSYLGLQDKYKKDTHPGTFYEFRWSNRPSTWLAATALGVMADGVKVKDLSSFHMPAETLNLTASWLANVAQDNVTGEFYERGALNNRLYASKTDIEVDGKIVPGNLALTAICVASLHKATSAANLGGDVLEAIKLGTEYLAKHYDETEDPLEMAVVTNALFVTGVNSVKQKAMSRLRAHNRTMGRMAYWSTDDIPAIKLQPTRLDSQLRLMPKKGSGVGAYTIIATSYALLAYMENGESSKDLDSIQRFLQEQHLSVGGFYSSHDTLIAMQALSALAERDQDRHTYDMTFTFTSDQDENWVKVVHLNKDNWFDLQKFKTPSHWGNIRTHAKGHGIALVQLRTIKNVDDDRAQLKKSPNRGIIDLGDFNKDITTSGFNHSFIHFKFCPQWNGETERSGMVVLEISLPSGYKASNWGSQKLVKAKKGTTSLRAAQHLNGLMVYYFDYLNKTRLNCVDFKSYRVYPVANVAELTRIKIYEYYEPANFLLTFYEKVELTKLTVCLICGSYQCPYCPFYSSTTALSPSIRLIYILSLLTLLLNFGRQIVRNT